MALSFPGAAELPHFDKASFRVNKKIFATLDEKNSTANVKLSTIDQSVFCAFDKEVIYPVPNKWGQQGWTTVELKKVKSAMLKDLLNQAFEAVQGKKS